MSLLLEAYKDLVMGMDDESIAQEFSDRIGNELNDYEWLMFHKGRQSIINKLIDKYEVEYGMPNNT